MTGAAWHEPQPVEFRGMGKIPRLFREAVATEKIDGIQAAIGIRRYQFGAHANTPVLPDCAKFTLDPSDDDGTGLPDNEYLVYAQSRNRIITPKQDNRGFAGWVWENAVSLMADLGEGLHFGEYWGSGINRGYGLDYKMFSLFNVKRWETVLFRTPRLGSVPVLARGEFCGSLVTGALDALRRFGSVAAPGYKRPEGVVVYHTAGNLLFKATIEDDELPKSLSVRPRQAEMELAA